MSCIDARGSHEHSGHSKTSKESRYYKTIEHKGNSPQKRRIHVITIKKARDDRESGCSSYQVLKFMSSLINQHNLYYHYKDDVFIKGCMHQRKRGPCHEGHTRYYFDLDSNDCKEFQWGGCEPNKNNFLTKQECREKCKKKSKYLFCNIQIRTIILFNYYHTYIKFI